MIAALLCGIAFALCYFAGRRTLVEGIAAVVGVGYFYGILRANFMGAASYFLFDAAVVGFYLARIGCRVDEAARARSRLLSHWLLLLVGWPTLLLLVPVQDPLVQLVGLRGHIFFLPFLLFGARLEARDMDRLTMYVAVLNLVALAFAGAEFFLGLPRFYPRSPVTELIYRSRDIAAAGSLLGAFRIPATFANAASYGATMVMTMPLLLGALMQRREGTLRRLLLIAAVVAAVLGVFMAASRTNVLVLAVLAIVAVLGARLGVTGRAGLAVMFVALSAFISTQDRLIQRVLSISPEAVWGRIAVSVNQTAVEYALHNPLGNGLGGGGTSMPYFLQGRVHEPLLVESHYATIMFEQGLPGLLLWIAFLAWVLARRGASRADRWALGRRLAWWACAAYYANGLIGIGFLTSIPSTVLLLVSTGWIAATRTPAEASARADADAPAAPARHEATGAELTAST